MGGILEPMLEEIMNFTKMKRKNNIGVRWKQHPWKQEFVISFKVAEPNRVCAWHFGLNKRKKKRLARERKRRRKNSNENSPSSDEEERGVVGRTLSENVWTFLGVFKKSSHENQLT